MTDKSDQPEPGDIVSFNVRAHPTMGKPYEVIGRVERDHMGLHAGGRYLSHAQGKIVIINGSVENGAQLLLIAAKGAVAALSQNKTYPADIDAAKKFLLDAISGAERSR